MYFLRIELWNHTEARLRAFPKFSKIFLVLSLLPLVGFYHIRSTSLVSWSVFKFTLSPVCRLKAPLIHFYDLFRGLWFSLARWVPLPARTLQQAREAEADTESSKDPSARGPDWELSSNKDTGFNDRKWRFMPSSSL